MPLDRPENDKPLAQLIQSRGVTTKTATLFEDRLEMGTSTFLGEVRSVLELDAVEGISRIRAASVPLTVAAFSSVGALLACAIGVMSGASTAADMRMLEWLAGAASVLVVLFLVFRENCFRIETFRRGHFTLFTDREPETSVIEFLGSVRRARQRHLRQLNEAAQNVSVADEIRKLAVLVSEGPQSEVDLRRRKKAQAEFEEALDGAADGNDAADDGEESGPRSIN